MARAAWKLSQKSHGGNRPMRSKTVGCLLAATVPTFVTFYAYAQEGGGLEDIVVTGGPGGTGGTGFTVRGIPNVGTYVDGVWQVGTNGLLTEQFVDIDRIEVLRGPQGTEFGRDSTGGAIRIWTKKPSDEYNGNVTVT